MLRQTKVSPLSSNFGSVQQMILAKAGASEANARTCNHGKDGKAVLFLGLRHRI